MQVTCNKCSSKYRIGDEKLKGRERIRLKCKKCDNIIEAKVNNSLKDEDTNSLFSMSSNKSITEAVKTKKEHDIFEDNLFSGNKDEFSFEDVKETLVLDTPTANFGSTGSTPSTESEVQPKFKSDFQMDFSDKTSQQNMLKDNPSSHNSAAVSFETTQQISVDKFNEYQKNKENQQAQSSSPKLEMKPTATHNHQSSTGKLKIDNKTRDKFNSISNANDLSRSLEDDKRGGGLIKFVFVILLLASLFFSFVLFKNNWNLDLNNLSGMIDKALGGKQNVKSKQDLVNKKTLKDQFFIDGKKIKADIWKVSRKRRDKRHILTVSGEIKNIDTVKKDLTTISVEVNDISSNETILTKRVYAGNYFTKKEILKAKNSETLDSEYLQSGKNGVNWGVLPQKVIPFMVVFYLDKKINIKKVKIKVSVKSTQ